MLRCQVQVPLSTSRARARSCCRAFWLVLEFRQILPVLSVSAPKASPNNEYLARVWVHAGFLCEKPTPLLCAKRDQLPAFSRHGPVTTERRWPSICLRNDSYGVCRHASACGRQQASLVLPEDNSHALPLFHDAEGRIGQEPGGAAVPAGHARCTGVELLHRGREESPTQAFGGCMSL